MTVADERVRRVIEQALEKRAWAPLTAEDLAQVAALDLSGQGLSALALPAGLTGLAWLDLGNNQLSELSLPELPGLKELWLHGNRLAVLTLPAGLAKLETLNLEGNGLREPSLPAGLTNLRWLNLASNWLAVLTLPGGLAKLETLHLEGNGLRDLTLPAGMAGLRELHLEGNPLEQLRAPVGLDIGQLAVSGYAKEEIVLDDPATAVWVADLAVRRAIEAALGKAANEPLTGAELEAVKALDLAEQGLTSLALPAGMKGLESLASLNVEGAIRWKSCGRRWEWRLGNCGCSVTRRRRSCFTSRRFQRSAWR